jgi:transposase-like protein
MKKHKVSPEVKEQIINRIKNDGLTVSEVAKDHGIAESTIHTWIARKVDGQPTLSEVIKLKKENMELKLLLGEITLRLSETQKKK